MMMVANKVDIEVMIVANKVNIEVMMVTNKVNIEVMMVANKVNIEVMMVANKVNIEVMMMANKVSSGFKDHLSSGSSRIGPIVQTVYLGDQYTLLRKILSTVPQSSVLWPLLFSLYTTDVATIICALICYSRCT